MEYQYPLDYTWTTTETVDVIQFFQVVEKAYESSITKAEFMKSYRRFKEIVPSKSEEKKLTDDFQKSSGYSTYALVTKVKEIKDTEKIRL